MSREKPAAGLPDTVARRLGRAALIELPNWQLLVLAVITGALLAASVFDWSFVAGRDAFWRFPKGTIPGSRFDMAQVLVGYFYYVQSPWQLPLFYVSALGAPVGANIIFMDAVPIVALVGKLIHSLSGATVNLYGAYLFLCFALPGLMMTLVLIAAKVRCAFAAVIGAIFADTMPVLLWQWGHIALQSHFLLIGALALYLFSLQKRSPSGLAAGWTIWLALSYLINVYLFAMVGTIWLCALIQRRLDRLATMPEAVAIGVLTVAIVTIVSGLSGQFGAGNDLPFAEYGRYSMNLLSPFVPQQSALVPELKGVIDATGRQYESDYLGLGLLLASLLVLPSEAQWLKRTWRRHWPLLIAFAALTAFAVSHRVYAGNRLLFELPMPYVLNRVLGIFQSSGRFFWPIGYAQVAMVAVLGFRRASPILALCLAGAAVLQVADVRPLREQIIASIAAGPSAAVLDRGQVAALVGGVHRIEVVPSFQCASNDNEWQANMELMLAAARANVPTNTVYLGRQSYGLTLRDVLRAPSRIAEMTRVRRAEYCARELEQARRGGKPGDVFVLLSDRPRPQEMAPGITCSPLSWAQSCERARE